MRFGLAPLWLAFSMSFGTRGFKSMRPMIEKFSLQKDLSKTMLAASSRKKKGDPFELFQHEKDDSPKRKIKSFEAKTQNQREYLDLMRDENVDIVVAVGPAGTGKTMLACYAAVEALRLRTINKIVITRPVVSVDEEIGFLPGGLESKMDPWTRPLFDVLRETYSAKDIEQMTEEGVLEIVPLGFMRGRTFKNAWIIADEMQNSSPTQMLMLATRIGEGSKMVITGDLNQSDRPGPNGLQEISSKLEHSSQECIKVVVLETEDVQRSRAAKAVLELYGEPKHIVKKVHKSNSEVNPPTEITFESKHSPVIHQTPQSKSTAFFPNVEHSVDGVSCDVDWVELKNNGDAALIPKKHFYPSPKN